MTLKSYTLKKIDEKNSNLVIEFVFEVDGKDTKETQTIQYNNDLKYWEEVNGKMVEKFRKSFDVTDKDSFDQQVREYAQAFINGKELEKSSVTPVSDDIKALLGVTNVQEK